MWMMNYFGGRRDPKQSAREAIVSLREQLLMNEKKEDLLKKKIDAAQKTAAENAIKDKQCASACPPSTARCC
jgi:charged multivesicular body protein 4